MHSAFLLAGLTSWESEGLFSPGFSFAICERSHMISDMNKQKSAAINSSGIMVVQSRVVMKLKSAAQPNGIIEESPKFKKLKEFEKFANPEGILTSNTVAVAVTI